MLVHVPGGEFTPCGLRFMKAMLGTFHSQACLDGRETCIGMHTLAVVCSLNISKITCPECLKKLEEIQ